MTKTIPDLRSFGTNLKIVVVGASGGIGSAVLDHVVAMENVSQIIALSRSGSVLEHPKVIQESLELDDEGSIQHAAALSQERLGALDLIFVATGLLHAGTDVQPEKSWKAIEPQAMEQVFIANCVGPTLVAKHFLPLMPKHKKAAFAAISARVGSISDNRLGGWHSYRASKAALNMVIKNLSIELARKWPEALAVGLHPGTVDTVLSEPFQKGVPEDRLFEPRQSAAYLLSVLNTLRAEHSGRVFAWDGSEVPA